MDIIKTRSDDVKVLLKKLKKDYELRLKDKNKIINALEADNERLRRINAIYSSERKDVLDMIRTKY